MVIGVYYLTLSKGEELKSKRIYDDPHLVELLYEKGLLKLHETIRFSFRGEVFETTVGRVIFNMKLREGIFDGDDDYPFINEVVGKKQLEKIISEFYDRYGLVKTDILLDNLKDIGFKFATYSGISIGLDDVKIPKERDEVIKEAQKQVEHINQQYEEGFTV
jgi:DNA-directed RNA polymerase, beta'' subunit/160 kD subunit